MPDVKDLLQQAMEFPPEARAALAGALLESLGSSTDADAEAAWSLEIVRRVRELERGAVNAAPWAEARKRIDPEADLSARDAVLLAAWKQAQDGKGRPAKEVLDDLRRK